jgi:hypothetical protein
MSQERSKSLWMGEFRRKIKFRQLCARFEYVATIEAERGF